MQIREHSSIFKPGIQPKTTGALKDFFPLDFPVDIVKLKLRIETFHMTPDETGEIFSYL